MKKVIAALLLVIPVMVLAGQDDLVCDYQGYASSPENFHNLHMEQVRTGFIVKPGFVVYNGVTYKAVDPQVFDLKGLALTYLNRQDGSILYLYINEGGEREVGISQIEVDSDNFFKDKQVFSKCTLITETKGTPDVITKPLLGVKEGGN